MLAIDKNQITDIKIIKNSQIQDYDQKSKAYIFRDLTPEDHDRYILCNRDNFKEIYTKLIDDRYITSPEEITEEAYFDALECLPPERFNGNSFHIVERQIFTIVAWYFKKAGKFYTFNNHDYITDAELTEIITNA